VLVLLAPLSYWIFAASTATAYPYQAYDPEYAYFLSALAPFNGGGYTYAHHPGTPLEVLGTIILTILYPFIAANPVGFIQYNLNHPELFLGLTHLLLLGSSMACAVLLYVTALSSRSRLDVLAAICIALMFYVIHPAAFVTLAYWSHNSFSFPMGAALALALFKSIEDSSLLHRKVVCLLGLGAGLLTSVVVYFGTWIVAGVLTIAVFYRLQGARWPRVMQVVLLYILACGAGFALGVLPMLPQASAMFGWLKRLAWHQGIYGTGAAGFTSASALQKNLSDLFRGQPVLFLVSAMTMALAAYACVRRWGRRREASHLLACTVGLLASIPISFLLVIKHPGPYYLLSVAALLPLLVLMLRRLLDDHRPLKQLLDAVLIVGVGIGLTVALPRAIRLQRDRSATISSTAEQLAGFVQERARTSGRQPEDIVIVWAYGVYDRCNALVRINNNYIHLFDEELRGMCPNQYIINDTFMSVPRGTSSDGSRMDLNELDWDFIVIKQATAANLIRLLETEPASVDLAGARTGLPGTEMSAKLVLIVSGH
jgi:hypothetical protein